jgi:hypothetical protein
MHAGRIVAPLMLAFARAIASLSRAAIFYLSDAILTCVTKEYDMGGSMFAGTIKLTLVTAALALIATSAHAQQVHPRCLRSKDNVKCTCWMANGAEMVPSRDGRGRRLRTTSQWDMDRIIACMRRNGRSNG